MSDKSPLEEPLRRAMEANLQYYEALGRVTQDYWKAVFGIWSALPSQLGAMATGPRAAPAAQAGQPSSAAPPSTAALVLEAEAGSEAQGVFMVENRLARTVSTAVVTSAFADRSGRAVRPALRITPGVVTLEPGGRTLVQLYAAVSDDLDADVDYRGEVTVPGLSDNVIPVVLRRRAGRPTSAPNVAG
jgi:hypothetical protein